jgi:eukaryotic-like serine/threonine-protein kinase
MSAHSPENELPAEERPTMDVSHVRPSAASEDVGLAPPAEEDAEPVTAAAPTFKSLPQKQPTRNRTDLDDLPGAGQQFGDFELLSLLGSGSFARVYLARQISLERQVALKISANRGTEARTLASLEHDHIVHVFSEVVDWEGDLRLLCMQYVPGTTLERLIQTLARRLPSEWSGRAIVECIDSLSKHPAAFDSASLREREFLNSCDFVEAVCWMGARLAEALAYAHDRGVLHRDIKPANILLNQYGRPLLADFNIALDPARAFGAVGEMFGGTLAYMAPEHLDAFNPEGTGSPDVVDIRSDIFALGVVLFELLTGHHPFASVKRDSSLAERMRDMAGRRRAGAPSPRAINADVPKVLDRVIRRCLDADPARRYQSGAELAGALDGCREWRRIESDLPSLGPFTEMVTRHPFLALMVLTFMPHVMGSLVNIPYNASRIVDYLTRTQQEAFTNLSLVYNVVVYPAFIWVVYRLVAPAFRAVRELDRSGATDAAEVANVRRQILKLPAWALGLSCLGWLPGGLVFPLGIDLMAGPIDRAVYGHFLISFTISGLIALTYTFFGIQLMVLRVIYPQLWVDAQDLRKTMVAELGNRRHYFSLFQVLAGIIPLAGAVLMVGVGPEISGERTFRLLVTGLIGAGMVGFGLANIVNNLLAQTLGALLGTERWHQTKRRPAPVFVPVERQSESTSTLEQDD